MHCPEKQCRSTSPEMPIKLGEKWLGTFFETPFLALYTVKYSIKRQKRHLNRRPPPYMGLCIYIYIYASGLISGPDFAFHELISGPGRVNKRSGSSETACFIVRNGVTVFRGIVATTEKSRNSPFGKMALLEAFCAFFWPPFPEALFSLTLVCCLLPRHLSKWTPAKRCKTRGFGAISRFCASSIPCGVSKKTSFCGPVLRIIFCVCYYFVRFDVRVFVEFGFQRSKNPWGCRTELVLKRVFSQCVRCARKFGGAGGARRCRFFPWFSGASQKWPRGCGAEGFSVFFGFFFGRRFRKLHVVLFPSLSLFLGVFLFCSHSSWDWWQRRIARVFLGSWLSTLLFLGGFRGLLRKTLFSP